MAGNVESSQSPEGSAAKRVSLSLPSDILTALDRLSKQSGQPQSHLLIVALRRGLGLSRSAASEVTAEDLQQISDRLAALEALPQRVEALEATVYRLQQGQRPAAPIPDPEFSLDHFADPTSLEEAAAAPLLECPKCDRPLGAPLKASGRLVCAKCGWTDKPRSASSSVNAGAELPADELKQLLAQAASEALTNMKPKSKQNPEPPSGKRFPLFGR